MMRSDTVVELAEADEPRRKQKKKERRKQRKKHWKEATETAGASTAVEEVTVGPSITQGESMGFHLAEQMNELLARDMGVGTGMAKLLLAALFLAATAWIDAHANFSRHTFPKRTSSSALAPRRIRCSMMLADLLHIFAPSAYIPICLCKTYKFICGTGDCCTFSMRVPTTKEARGLAFGTSSLTSNVLTATCSFSFSAGTNTKH